MEKELQKQIVRQNLIFWGKVAERYIVITEGMIWCYMLLFSWIGENNLFEKNEIWSILFIYQIMLLLISTFVVPVSYGMVYISLVLSFGSKRDEAVWGFQLMNWLVMGVMGALLVLFACLSSINSEQLLLILLFILFGGIVGIALGQFAVVLGFQFGKKGLWIAAGVFMILFMIVGISAIFSVVGRSEISIKKSWLWLWAGLSVALYIGSLFALLRVVRKSEVRY